MIVKCPKCQTEFENEGKWGIRQYCTRKCANSRGVRSEETKKKIARSVCETLGINYTDKAPIHCLFCKEVLRSGRNYYCSRNCEKKHSWHNAKNEIIMGRWHEPKRLIQYLTETVGYHCVWCANGGEHNGKPLVLQLDHIDGNSDNNFPSNLRLLCPNCHTQTETYKNRNKNSSRAKWRKEYYRDVLSKERIAIKASV